MKVLHVVPTLSVRMGGPAFNVVGSALAMKKLGVESTIFSTDLAAPASATYTPARVTQAELPAGAEQLDYELFPVSRPARLAYSPEMGRALRARVREFDLVHIHTLFLYPQYAAFREARRAGVPHVVSPRGALDPYLRQRGRMRKYVVEKLWQRRMIDTAQFIHLTTTDESALIEDLAYRAPHRIVPNGINLAGFETLPPREVFRRELQIDDTRPLVLYHGRISEKKGIDLLIRAFAQVRASHPDALLVIVGPNDDGLQDGLEQLAASLSLSPECVRFVGMRTGPKLLEALSAGDVWVLASHSENFGVAVVEALAAGLPVVTTPHVNIARDMELADAGVVSELNPEAIAKAAVDLLDNQPRRRALSANARLHAATYDWGSVAHGFVEMYADAIAGARSGSVLVHG